MLRGHTEVRGGQLKYTISSELHRNVLAHTCILSSTRLNSDLLCFMSRTAT
eukprot:COSAG01_NODE_39285_length_478_cov_3.451187_1_plen_50_part_10